MPLSDEQVRALLALAGDDADDGERYEEVEPIGEGGMGQVTAVWDGTLLREVALKQLKPQAGALTERFLREARITAQLEHPHIVPVYDLDEGEEPSFTMLRIRGASLADRLAEDPAPDRSWCLEVFLKVCDAMAYAHEHGVVHRDLKPDNVMVGRFGEVYVVDWGLAKRVGEPDPEQLDAVVSGASTHTRVGAVSGTPHYMAPEQAAGTEVDERTDIYGLGRLLATMLSGAPQLPPEAGATGVLPPWELAAVIRRATAAAPADRYPTVLALQGDVRAYQEHRPLPTLTYSVVRRVVKGVERHRAVALASSLTGLVAGLLLAVVVYQQSAQHLEVLTEARDEAVQAERRAVHELGRAQLALAWEAVGRDDVAGAVGFLDEASELLGANATELLLARAWLHAERGRPWRIWASEGVLFAVYGRDGAVVAGDHDHTWVIDRQGSPHDLSTGLLVAQGSEGVLHWLPDDDRPGEGEGTLRLVGWDGHPRWHRRLPSNPRAVWPAGSEVLGVSAVGAGTWLLSVHDGTPRMHTEAVDILHGITASGDRLLGLRTEGSRHRAPDAVWLVDGQGEVIERIEGTAGTMMASDGRIANDDGRHVFLIDGERRRVVDAERPARLYLSDHRMHVWADPHLLAFGLDGPVTSVALPINPRSMRSDGQRGLITVDGRLEEWALDPLPSPPMSPGGITELAVSPDGQLVAAVDWSGHLVVFDAITRRKVHDERVDADGLRGVAWTPDGRAVAVAGRSGRAAVVDLVTGEERWSMERPGIIAMDVHYDDDELVIAFEDGTLFRRRGAGHEEVPSPSATVWALAGPPLVVSGRGDFDPVVAVDMPGTVLPEGPGYGIDAWGDRVAAGTSDGVVLVDRAAGTVERLLGSTTLDVAFLGPDVLLAATYEGNVAVWVRASDGWVAGAPLPIGPQVVGAVTVHGATVWIAHGDGEVVDLHLGETPVMNARDALRRGWLDHPDLEQAQGLTAVRVAWVEGDHDQAAALAASVDGPSAAILAGFLRTSERL